MSNNSHQYPVCHFVNPEALERSDISSLLALRCEIQTRTIANIVFIADKRNFTDDSARKAEAAYIQQLIHAWPDFLFFCEQSLAAQLQQMLYGKTSVVH